MGSNKPVQDATQVQARGQGCKERASLEKGSGWIWRQNRWSKEAYCCEVWSQPCHIPHRAGGILLC